MSIRSADHKGIVYKTENAMCEAYDILVRTYRYRRQQGIPIKQALTLPRVHRNPSLTLTLIGK